LFAIVNGLHTRHSSLSRAKQAGRFGDILAINEGCFAGN
jgi:hypothetical protein